MPLGIAIVIVFILYLIDKHNRWRQALKITLGIIALVILGLIGLFGWQKYEAWQDARQEARQQAEAEAEQAKQVAQKQAELATSCKDWEDKHPIGSALDQIGKFVLDPPQGCEGQLETAYANKVAAWVAPNRPAKFKNQPDLAWAVVMTDYGLFSILRRCAFDVGTFPCGYLDSTNGEIAHLNKGDRVQVLSDKVRAPNGTEIYKIRFQQWTGWGNANELNIEPSAQ